MYTLTAGRWAGRRRVRASDREKRGLRRATALRPAPLAGPCSSGWALPPPPGSSRFPSLRTVVPSVSAVSAVSLVLVRFPLPVSPR